MVDLYILDCLHQLWSSEQHEHYRLGTVIGNRDSFGTQVALNGVEGQIFHPTLVNVVLHGGAKAFKMGMHVNVRLQGLRFDVFFSFDLNRDDALFGLDSEINVHFGFVGGVIDNK